MRCRCWKGVIAPTRLVKSMTEEKESRAYRCWAGLAREGWGVRDPSRTFSHRAFARVLL